MIRGVVVLDSIDRRNRNSIEYQLFGFVVSVSFIVAQLLFSKVVVDGVAFFFPLSTVAFA